MRDDDGFVLAPPDLQLHDHQRQVLSQRSQRVAIAIAGQFGHQDGDMVLVGMAHAVASPVVEHSEALRSLQLAEPDIHAEVVVIVTGQEGGVAVIVLDGRAVGDLEVTQPQARGLLLEPGLQPGPVLAQISHG